MLTQEDVERCQALVYRHVKPTPELCWPVLCEAVGCEVWVKHENHTPIGAFKVRGGLVYLDEMHRSGDTREIVTATRGNHGQSIPFAARLYGRTAHVYVPEGNSVEKNAAMRAWGATLHVAGDDFDAAREAAMAHVARDGGHGVPSFHEHLVRGVATYGYELMTAVAELDVIYVPIGQGSGASGLVAVRDLLGVTTEIVGVVSTEADSFALSLEAGRIVSTNAANTYADGVATRTPDPDAFAYLSKGLARVVRVTDDEVADATRLLYRATHNVAEGAGAAATAALIAEKASLRGRKAAVILSGGNIDAAWFADILAGRTPTPR